MCDGPAFENIRVRQSPATIKHHGGTSLCFDIGLFPSSRTKWSLGRERLKAKVT